jgi:hypothetical protein
LPFLLVPIFKNPAFFAGFWAERLQKIVELLINKLPGLSFKRSKAKSGKSENVTRVTGSDAVIKWSEGEQPEPEKVRAAMKKKLDEVYPKLAGVYSILKPLLL